MPVIIVNMLEGRSIEQKKNLVSKMTDILVETIDTKSEKIKIIINEMPRENYAVGGKLYSEENK